MIEIIKRNWLILGLSGLIIGFIIVSTRGNLNKDDQLIPISSSSIQAENDQSMEETDIIVDVKGEVRRPGVYEISSNSRINDVIQLAGGFTDDADEMFVNLAQKVQDEMTIIVPKAGDDSSTNSMNTSSKVKINYATQAEIESLSGIGPSKAQAIIKHREEHGFFKSVEDLLEVSGIGDKTLENIRDEIQIP